MDINSEQVDGKTLIHIGGRVDSTAAIKFEEEVIKVIDGGTNSMIIDFEKIQFMSSAGLRVLLLAAKKVKPYGGQIVLCQMSDDVKEVFDISGFSSLFIIESGIEGALSKI